MFTQMLQAISTLGFPIVVSIASAWYIKYITDMNRTHIEEITKSHKTEVDNITFALNNNTLALQRISDFLLESEGVDIENE